MTNFTIMARYLFSTKIRIELWPRPGHEEIGWFSIIQTESLVYAVTFLSSFFSRNKVTFSPILNLIICTLDSGINVPPEITVAPPLKNFYITILILFYINLGIAVIFKFFCLQKFSKINKHTPMFIPKSRVLKCFLSMASR